MLATVSCNNKTKWRWALGLAAAVLLHATPGRAAEVQGRVVDSMGRPIAGAAIRIWRKQPNSANRIENQIVATGGNGELQTDADGRFRAADLSDLGESVCIVAQSEATLAARSRWAPSAEGALIDVGDVVVRRLRTISGRVRDRQGAPVEGATVFHSGDGSERVETITGADGDFRLDRVPAGRIALFAERVGFRFAGSLLDAKDSQADLRLVRDEESLEPLATLPPVLAAEQEKALARQTLAPFLERLPQADDRSKTIAIFALALIDESEALQRLDTISFEDAEEKDRVREQTLETMAERPSADWEEVKALAESLSLPASKAAFYIFAARAKLACQRPEPQTLLSEALLHARAIHEPKRRALELARIACGLFDLGFSAKAEPLAREAFAILDPLPVGHDVSWDTTGAVAMAVAHYDLPAARALLGRLHYDEIYAYEAGRLAYQTALADAEQAESLWLASAARSTAQNYSLRWRDTELAAPTCYRLARREPIVARRVAEGLTDASSRIAATGAIAQATAETDEPAARKSLRELILGLPSVGALDRYGRADGERNIIHSQAAACCRLLPLAERIDPQFARECLWRVVALRPRRDADLLDNEAERAELYLIRMLARYDRRLAAALLEPLEAKFDEFVASDARDAVLGVMVAAASIDPRQSLKLLDRLPPAADANVRQLSNIVRVMLAWNLCGSDPWRWQGVGYSDPASFEIWR